MFLGALHRTTCQIPSKLDYKLVKATFYSINLEPETTWSFHWDNSAKPNIRAGVETYAPFIGEFDQK
jgi:hypothetical protein